jgi:hypothetical protein
LIAFAGRGGDVVLVSMGTKQWVGEVHMNSDVRALSFSSDGRSLYTAGGKDKDNVVLLCMVFDTWIDESDVIEIYLLFNLDI